MSRLPLVGGDISTWGTILNDFLSVAHNADGTPKTSASPELAYAQITAPVTVSATVEASGTAIVTAPAFTADGATVVLVEFYAPYGQVAAGANTALTVCLFEGATELGRLCYMVSVSASAFNVPFFGRLRLTPSAASHTYSVTAFEAGGSAVVGAGAGGTGAYAPASIRVSRA